MSLRYGKRASDKRLARLVQAEVANHARSEERRLLQERDEIHASAAPESGAFDGRYNPNVNDEGTMLLHQLTYGARLTPHSA